MEDKKKKDSMNTNIKKLDTKNSKKKKSLVFLKKKKLKNMLLVGLLM